MGQFKVYKSSAGSGKTFTLVLNYLCLCLGTNDSFVFRRILAITFTNKASQEMKSRILEELQQIAKSSETEESITMLDKLMEELQLERDVIVERAKRVFPILLHYYGDFSVSTIDRFTLKILRTFSKDLGLAYNFEIELQEKIMLSEVIDQLLSDYGLDEGLSNELRMFLRYKMGEGKSWKLHKDLVDFALYSLNEKSYPYLASIRGASKKEVEACIQEVRQRIQSFELALDRIGKTAMQLIKKYGLTPTALYYGEKGIYAYFKRLAEGDFSKIAPNSYVRKTVEEDKWLSGKATVDDKQALESIQEQLKGLGEEALQLVSTEQPNYIANMAVLKCIHPLRLLQSIEQRLHQWKQEENILNISDFNRLIAEVVIQEAIPYIYERIGEFYHHIMVDEFQDTSILQFINIAPLLEESLSKGNLNLLVGDPKQAIYRFRGGEVEQFVQLPNSIKVSEEYAWHQERMQAIAPHYEPHIMGSNFRSDEYIVDFNNRFFEFVRQRFKSTNTELSAIFEGHEQDPFHDNKNGWVELKFADEEEGNFKEANFEWVYQKIQENHEDGYAYEDILVLSRNNSDLNAIANYLKEKGISILSADALKVAQSRLVQFFLQLYQFIQAPEDIQAKQAMISFLSQQKKGGNTQDYLYRKYLKEEADFISHLSQEYAFDHAFAASLSLYELLEYAIRSFELLTLMDQFGLKFQEIILNYSQQKGDSIPQFLRWWELYGEDFSVPATAEANAVALMSVHKSKGLEYPVVIYPFANDSVAVKGGRMEYLWVDNRIDKESALKHLLVPYDKELKDSVYADVFEEELRRREVDLVNLAYVAFTRAKNRLYLFAKQPAKDPSGVSLDLLLAEFAQTQNVSLEEGYQFGAKSRKVQKESAPVVEEEKVFHYRSHSWRDRLRIAPATSISANAVAYNEQQSFGILLHDFLAKLKDFKKWEEALERFEEEGRLDAQSKKQLAEQMHKLMEMEELKTFFDPQFRTKTEADLFDGKGRILRPDRIVYFEEEIAILDYKTGAKSEKHKTQMEKYATALQQIHQEKVSAYLLYTAEPVLEKVDLTQ